METSSAEFRDHHLNILCFYAPNYHLCFWFGVFTSSAAIKLLCACHREYFLVDFGVTFSRYNLILWSFAYFCALISFFTADFKRKFLMPKSDASTIPFVIVFGLVITPFCYESCRDEYYLKTVKNGCWNFVIGNLCFNNIIRCISSLNHFLNNKIYI